MLRFGLGFWVILGGLLWELARGFDYCGGVCVGLVCFGVVCDCARWCLFGLIWVLDLVVDLGFGFVCDLGDVGV